MNKGQKLLKLFTKIHAILETGAISGPEDKEPHLDAPRIYASARNQHIVARYGPEDNRQFVDVTVGTDLDGKEWEVHINWWSVSRRTPSETLPYVEALAMAGDKAIQVQALLEDKSAPEYIDGEGLFAARRQLEDAAERALKDVGAPPALEDRVEHAKATKAWSEKLTARAQEVLHGL